MGVLRVRFFRSLSGGGADSGGGGGGGGAPSVVSRATSDGSDIVADGCVVQRWRGGER